jgi:hypothetical protein
VHPRRDQGGAQGAFDANERIVLSVPTNLLHWNGSAWQALNRAAYCEAGSVPALMYERTCQVRLAGGSRRQMTEAVLDVLAIQQLLAHYCLYVDDADFESWAALFAADAEMHAFGQVWRGPGEIVEHVSQGVRGLHMAGTPSLTLDGDHANGQQNFVFVEKDGHALRIGRYVDEYVRIDGSWRFASRKIIFTK